jgi:hypothetical protein
MEEYLSNKKQDKKEWWNIIKLRHTFYFALPF